MKNFDANLRGLYKMEAVRPDGERRVLLDWFDNLILDAGLNRLGTGGAFNRCMVGTSSGAVVPAQTALGAQIAVTTTVENATNGVNIGAGYVWSRRTFRFPIGAATGNITEVGVGWDTTLCFSRALTVDAGGAPVAITVLSDEFLDVTYELRMHWPVADIVATASISGTSHNVVTRAAQIGSWGLSGLIENGARPDLTPPGQGTSFGPGALGDITLDAGGVALNSVNLTYASSYANNSLQRTYRATFGLAAGSSSISNFRFSTPFGIFKSSFNPVIPKASSNNLTLDYRITWGRFTPFTGVNPGIGPLNASASVESPNPSASVVASIEFRTNGSIFQTVSNFSGAGANATTQIGVWHIPNIAGIGSGFEIQFIETSGSGGTLFNGATSYSNLGAANVSVVLSSDAQGDFTRTLTYNIRPAGGGATLATGAITLSISLLNA